MLVKSFLTNFRHADSVLQHELKQTGVPINQINEPDGDEEYWGHDIKGKFLLEILIFELILILIIAWTLMNTHAEIFKPIIILIL